MSQLESKPLDFNPIAEAEKVIDGYTDHPEIKIEGFRACYNPAKDRVSMPDAERFVSESDFYGVLFHELAHSTAHQSRLDRVLNTVKSSDEYAFEELIAELTSAFLCSHCGILDATFDRSADYLSGWLKAFKSDANYLIKAASKAQAAADHILKVEFGN